MGGGKEKKRRCREEKRCQGDGSKGASKGKKENLWRAKKHRSTVSTRKKIIRKRDDRVGC